jgi:molybdate transport system substrate-binding protein
MIEMRKTYPILSLVFILFLQVACTNSDSKQEKKELLIYCGITMIKPMTEIKQSIEKQEHCSIEITKGGSGNLLKALETSGIGDLYLPGADNYIYTAFSKGLIVDTATVGKNRLAMMVQKGNPLHISSDLANLINKNYYVVIGNPNSGSVGKTTKKVLEKRGIFSEVEQNAVKFTTDSKDLTLLLKNKEADLVINWYATYTWDDNSKYMDAIAIDDKYEPNKKLILATLKSSKYPEIAQAFLKYASSEKGKAIFKKYGLN